MRFLLFISKNMDNKESQEYYTVVIKAFINSFPSPNMNTLHGIFEMFSSQDIEKDKNTYGNFYAFVSYADTYINNFTFKTKKSKHPIILDNDRFLSVFDKNKVTYQISRPYMFFNVLFKTILDLLSKYVYKSGPQYLINVDAFKKREMRYFTTKSKSQDRKLLVKTGKELASILINVYTFNIDYDEFEKSFIRFQGCIKECFGEKIVQEVKDKYDKYTNLEFQVLYNRVLEEVDAFLGHISDGKLKLIITGTFFKDNEPDANWNYVYGVVVDVLDNFIVIKDNGVCYFALDEPIEQLLRYTDVESSLIRIFLKLLNDNQKFKAGEFDEVAQLLDVPGPNNNSEYYLLDNGQHLSDLLDPNNIYAIMDQ